MRNKPETFCCKNCLYRQHDEAMIYDPERTECLRFPPKNVASKFSGAEDIVAYPLVWFHGWCGEFVMDPEVE